MTADLVQRLRAEVQEVHDLAKRVADASDYVSVLEELRELPRRLRATDLERIRRTALNLNLDPRERYFLLSVDNYNWLTELDEYVLPHITGEESPEQTETVRDLPPKMQRLYTFEYVRNKISRNISDQDNYEEGLNDKNLRSLNNFILYFIKHTLQDLDQMPEYRYPRKILPVWRDFFTKHEQLVTETIEEVDKFKKARLSSDQADQKLVENMLECYKILRLEYGIPDCELVI